MKTYRLKWKRTEYGESFVEAKSKKEALKLADMGQDRDFENFADTYGNAVSAWEVEAVEREDD